MRSTYDYRNLERDTKRNTKYRVVLHTTKQQQLVLMSLEPGEDIPMEVHTDTTQFIRVESGRGVIQIGRKLFKIRDGFSLVIPAGSSHYVRQIGPDPLKLYTIYSPPEHPKNRIDIRQLS